MTEHSNERLPYDFDLFWDIKTKEQLYDILKGGIHCTEVNDTELLEMMIHHNIPIPKDYILPFKPDFPKEIWIDNNGNYLTYPPENKDKYQLMVRPSYLIT
jgi:hypothetical protein